jgi:hypothetical protein
METNSAATATAVTATAESQCVHECRE